MRDTKSIIKYGLSAAAIAFSLMLINPVQARAAYTVEHDPQCEASNENHKYKDRNNIQEAMATQKDIKLESGKTYYLAGPLDAVDGVSIDATGATIVCEKVILHNPTTSKSISNFSITGGTWLRSPTCKSNGSSFRFHYGDNLKFVGMDIQHADIENHAIELVACKNVLIKDCKITGQGTGGSKSVEEQIQIDIAAPKTASFLKDDNNGLLDGTCCENITIDNCEVTGCRAVCANYAKGGKYANCYHKNITVTNCTLTGETAEGLMIFNTKGIKVKDNTIISNAPKKRKYFSPGLHIQIYGSGKGGFSKGKVVITNNEIKGGAWGAMISANTSKTEFGKVTIKGNNIYTKGDKSDALHVDSCKKLKNKNNKLKKW